MIVASAFLFRVIQGRAMDRSIANVTAIVEKLPVSPSGVLGTGFRLSPRYRLIERIADWDGAQHSGEPFFYYQYRCRLWRGSLPVAEADGSCNSWEKKYRFRSGERIWPACAATAIIKGRPEYGGGWLCYRGKGGCGAKWSDGDTVIEQAARPSARRNQPSTR